MQIAPNNAPLAISFGDYGAVVVNRGPGTVTYSDRDDRVAQSTLSSGNSATLTGTQYFSATVLSELSVIPLQAERISKQLASASIIGGARIAAVGASITTQHGVRPGFDLSTLGFLTWAMYLSGGQLKYAGSWGTGGVKAASVQANDFANLLAQPGPLPQYLVFDDSVNNMSSVADMEDAKLRTRQNLGTCRALGIEPIFPAIVPRNSGTGTEYQNISHFNAWRARFCELNRAIFVDWHTPLVDTSTGGYITGFLAAGDGSGLHPSNAACKIMGQALVTALANSKPFWQPKLVGYSADPLNLIPDGCFTGATGGGAAGLASAWTPLSASTPTYSQVTADATIKGNWQRFVQAGSGLGWIVSTPAFALIVGHRYRFSGILKINAMGTGAAINVGIANATGGTDFGNEANQLTWSSQTISAVNNVFELDFGIYAGGPATGLVSAKINGGTGDFQMAQMGLYDLTALGIA